MQVTILVLVWACSFLTFYLELSPTTYLSHHKDLQGRGVAVLKLLCVSKSYFLQYNQFMSCVRLSFLCVVMIWASSVGYSLGFEISLERTSDTEACIKFRTTSTSDWGYFRNNQITDQTAEYLCRTFNPEAVSGAISTKNYGCYFRDTYVYTSSTTILDCPYNSTSPDNCTLAGATTTPTYHSSLFYADSIHCILSAEWASSIEASLTYLEPGGTYGTDTGRTLTLNSSLEIDSLRPDWAFKTGTICMPTTTPAFSDDVVQALCRTAELPYSSAVVSEGTYTNADQRYISNIQCNGSNLATLWNGGCTFNTSYYSEPTEGCSPYRPKLHCPISYEIRLAPPIESTWPDNGFQELQLRVPGTTEYTGTFCPKYGNDRDYAQYTARAVCGEMYGDDYDFPVSTYTRDRSTAQLEKYFISLHCPLSTGTSLSQCSTYASTSSATCTNPPTLITCKISEATTKFTLERDESLTKNVPGYGYLVGFVRSTLAYGAVCSNGFNQDAALAACRSLGYTPGPSATFTTITTSIPTTLAFNNVTCPSGADKLTDCKLQYTGPYHRLSSAAASICGGRVLLDCDLGGTPTDVQFRLSTDGYAQARLFSTSNWGWVETSSVARYEAYDVFCSRNISSDGSDNISGGVIRITDCPNGATEHTQCTVTYLEGADSYYSHYRCKNAWKRPTNDDTTKPNLGLILGIALGVPAGIAFIVFIVILTHRDEMKKKAMREANQAKIQSQLDEAEANRKRVSEMSHDGDFVEEEFSPKRQENGNTANSGGGGGNLVYGNDLSIPTTNNTAWNDDDGMGTAPTGFSHANHHSHQAGPPHIPQGGGGGYYPSGTQPTGGYGNTGIYGEVSVQPGFGGANHHQLDNDNIYL